MDALRTLNLHAKLEAACRKQVTASFAHSTMSCGGKGHLNLWSREQRRHCHKMRIAVSETAQLKHLIWVQPLSARTQMTSCRARGQKFLRSGTRDIIGTCKAGSLTKRTVASWTKCCGIWPCFETSTNADPFAIYLCITREAMPRLIIWILAGVYVG